MDAAIYFAAVGNGTGLYLALSCYFSGASNAQVDALSYSGYFEVQGQSYAGGCVDNEMIVGSGPGLDLLSGADLSG